jgi:hypothetical protein
MTSVAVARLGELLETVGAPPSLAAPLLVVAATVAFVSLTMKALRGFSYDMSKLSKIPGPPSLPIIGNGWDLAVPHHEVMHVSGKSSKSLW